MHVTIYDKFDGHPLVLTPDNTTLVLFPGAGLDHVVVVNDNEKRSFIFDDALVLRLGKYRIFTYMVFPTRPEWAVDLCVTNMMRDIDRGLPPK